MTAVFAPACVDGHCPNCGSKMVSYRHRLTEPIARALLRLHQAGGGPVNLRELQLTRNQWDNFQKLRYFSLVRQHYNAGVRARGVWEITDLGRQFVRNATTIRSTAVTYRGQTVALEGDAISIGDAIPGYQQDWPGQPWP